MRREEVAVITGAASGIGRHFEGEMERRGYRLVLPLSRGLLAKFGNLVPGLVTFLTRSPTARGLKTLNNLASPHDS